MASASRASTRSRSASDARKSRGACRALMSSAFWPLCCTGRGGTRGSFSMTEGGTETVMGQASQEQIRLVRFLYADHGGIIRGKASGTGHLRELMASGIGHTVAMMAMSMLDQLQPVPGM